jgi:hypothetical protein
MTIEKEDVIEDWRGHNLTINRSGVGASQLISYTCNLCKWTWKARPAQDCPKVLRLEPRTWPYPAGLFSASWLYNKFRLRQLGPPRACIYRPAKKSWLWLYDINEASPSPKALKPPVALPSGPASLQPGEEGFEQGFSTHSQEPELELKGALVL